MAPIDGSQQWFVGRGYATPATPEPRLAPLRGLDTAGAIHRDAYRVIQLTTEQRAATLVNEA